MAAEGTVERSLGLTRYRVTVEALQWFAFHAARLRDYMREWLADNGIEPTTAPPRRSGDAAPWSAP